VASKSQPDQPRDTVLLAYLHPNEISHNFHDSLNRLIGYDLTHGGNIVRGGGMVSFRCGAGGLVEGRNKVVRHFLDENSAQWLMLIDVDMGFAPDTVARLLDAADAGTRPVVGALCFGLKEVEGDGMGGWLVRPFPTLYDWARDRDGTFGFHIRRDYQPNTLTRVAGTGAACLLIHRSVLEKIRAELGDIWFDPSKQTDGRPVSEDLSFCYRVNAAGFPVFVHTGVRTTHHKDIWVGEDLYRVFESLWTAGQDEMAGRAPAPEIEEVAAVGADS
jgi:GT2 family glycosyltransferase